MTETIYHRHVKLPEKYFRHLGQFIQNEIGIKMPPAKKTMLEARLQRRLRALGIGSFADYCKYLFSPEGQENELVHMLDAVTTNKTDFFREPAHFDYLLSKALPDMIQNYGVGINRPFKLWSAGCSTGEEPYTLAMVLSEFASRCEGFNFTILATDISTKVLEKAYRAVYEASKVESVPMDLKRKYILRSKDRDRKQVRMAPEIRSLVRFQRLNFMSEEFEVDETFDMIFCRNVIIYFDRQTQEKLLNRFCRHLLPGGYIFMGHSETLNGLNIPLYPVFPTVYRVTDGREPAKKR